MEGLTRMEQQQKNLIKLFFIPEIEQSKKMPLSETFFFFSLKLMYKKRN